MHAKNPNRHRTVTPETANMSFDASLTHTVPELLAPAGGPEAFRAALANGADAIYLGVEVLNARRGAENFTLETLSDACRSAHLAGTKVYLTANVVVLPSEMSQALALIDDAWARGVDAVIVQDLGLLRAVRLALPHVRVHTSTQVNSHNTATIAVLESLGVSRVTLAREVALEEISAFTDAQKVEIEAFVHGALCVCYSGQCLMSSLIGGRSANRGQCAQPCRLPYELIGQDGEPVGTPGAHLLSPKDLAGIAMLGQLVEAGVSAIKIEGRMKSAEYVALVTGVYRAALDRAAADAESYVVRDGEQAVLSEAFSRGFSEAYLIGERGNDMMSYARPNNRGVPLGRVVAFEGARATVSLDSPLDSEDTIEFWTSSGRFAQAAGELGYDGATHATAPAGKRVELTVQDQVGMGDRVFRVRNAALTSAAARTFAHGGRPVSLRVSVRAIEGEALTVEVVDSVGRRGSSRGPVVEAARTKSLTADEVIEHVGRFGGTPYAAESWDIELATGVGLGFSALHRVRREALEDYERGVLAPWASRRSYSPQLLLAERRSRRGRRVAPELVVAVESRAVAKAVLEAGASAVHIPTYLVRPEDSHDPRWVPLLPRILHDAEFSESLEFATSGARVVAGNLGALAESVHRGAIAEAHWSLNAVNSHAVEQLADLGASRVWLSPELTGQQIAQIAEETTCELGTVIYGRQEVMVTEHCILMAEGPCDQQCRGCSRRAQHYTLRDRKGYEFPVVTDVTGRSRVYNSVPLDLISVLPELIDAGVHAVRVDAATDTAEQAAEVVRAVRRGIDAAMAGVPVQQTAREGRTTSGHYFRGLS